MRVHADFNKQVVIRPADYAWVPSPMPGVARMMLDRVGDEVARATSLVRYAPDSSFSSHTHGGGEEYLVLEGIFADEHGEYPVGTYARNPIGTAHTPRIGSEGAIIFVKLRQFDEADTAHFTLDTNAAPWEEAEHEGTQVKPLHQFGQEMVRLLKLSPHTRLPRAAPNKARELLILSGRLWQEDTSYPEGTWIRTPSGQPLPLHTKSKETIIWEKQGLLPNP